MNATKLISAWLAAFVVIFLLSGLWHQLLLADFYAAQTAAVARAEINMVAVTIGSLILAFLMAWMYPTGYQGGSPVVEGLRFGALIGLLWILPWSVIITGIWNVGMTVTLVDAAWHVVEEGLAGVVIGLVYGRKLAKVKEPAMAA